MIKLVKKKIDKTWKETVNRGSTVRSRFSQTFKTVNQFHS